MLRTMFKIFCYAFIGGLLLFAILYIYNAHSTTRTKLTFTVLESPDNYGVFRKYEEENYVCFIYTHGKVPVISCVQKAKEKSE